MIILKQCKENERMIELRKQKGLTQKQLAKELQLDQSMISCVERGKKEFGRDNKVKIANYFSVSVEYLFYENYINESLKIQNQISNLYDQQS
ncbi:helix-turn-helix transcriptional regulator [Pseudobacillus sp. FSL P4-0506]|uniref:helix-turn-helix domain-containing protein n=1 Tax=Pseudobacillus sp. FSL P4-0506 TaxID=2921576 RepID=UPI0030F6A547